MNFYYSKIVIYILLIVPKYGFKMHDYFYFVDSNIGYFNFISNSIKNNHISHTLVQVILNTFKTKIKFIFIFI
jgi:hypothetical protein